jgi:uncharacterized protein YbcV (DUF1398 family)
VKEAEMNTELMHDTLAKSVAGTIGFPEVVRALTEAGVESYRADLVRLEGVFYMPDGRTHVETMGYKAGGIADKFDAAEVVAAIRESQAGRSKYAEFLSRAMGAGTTNYVVYLDGRKVIYFGRRGEFHVEEFPQAGR